MTHEQLLVRVGSIAAGLLDDFGGHTSFRLLDSYRARLDRPVLGQVFEDAPTKVWRHNVRVPAWFANLLPEGQLRGFLAERLGVSASRDAPLLAAVGADLPGAVTVEPTGVELDPSDDVPEADPPIRSDGAEDGVRFSVAGYQLKFSMARSDDRKGLTLPGRGQLGGWLVKLPSTAFPEVPRNEWTIMRWAGAVGLSVPEVDLVDVGDLDLPDGIGTLPEPLAFAIERFDRGPGGARVHIEDLNQVLGRWPHEKYQGASFESLGAVIGGVTGSSDDLIEFVRRLVFMVAVGNEDAHLKNWSLIYRDGRSARLAPAYDLVSTVTYGGLQRGLGLSLARSKRFTDVSRASFARLSQRVGLDELSVLAAVDDTRERILASVDEFAPQLGPLESGLRAHLRTVPLFKAE